MRPRGSRQTASSCSCSRRPSRRAWLSRCPRTRCACTTPRSSPCRTCSRGLTTRPRSPASRPWRRPASEPICYSLRDPRPGPSQGVSRPLRAGALARPPPQTARSGDRGAPPHRPARSRRRRFLLGGKEEESAQERDAPPSLRCLRGPAPVGTLQSPPFASILFYSDF